MCGRDAQDVVGLPSAQIQQLISPTPDQQATPNDFLNWPVSSVRVALADFYRSLSDEQKAQFNTIGGQRSARRQG
jgi:hypothetical protein